MTGSHGDTHDPTGSADSDPLYEISRRAWQTNRRRAAQLAEIVAELDDEGVLPDDRRQLAASLSHQLVGSAGTFGHAVVSESARRIETLLVELPALVPAGRAELRRLVHDVRDTLEQGPAHDS